MPYFIFKRLKMKCDCVVKGTKRKMLVIIFERLQHGVLRDFQHCNLEFHCSADWSKSITAMAVAANQKIYAFAVLDLPPGVYEYKWRLHTLDRMPKFAWINDNSGRTIVPGSSSYSQILRLENSLDYYNCIISSIRCFKSCRVCDEEIHGYDRIVCGQFADVDLPAYFGPYKEICHFCTPLYGCGPWKHCYDTHRYAIGSTKNTSCFIRFERFARNPVVWKHLASVVLKKRLPDDLIRQIVEFI